MNCCFLLSRNSICFMNHAKTAACFLLIAVLFSACGKEGGAPTNDEDLILPDSVNTEGMATVSSQYQIQSLGLAFVDLGQPLNEMDTIIPGLGVLQDTLMYDQGYFLATRTLHLDDGSIVIEGEYIDEAQVNDTLIAESSVNRVRIETPSFQTQKGISVGMPVGILSQRFPEMEFYINPLINYQALDITGAFDTHIHYLVQDPGNEIARKAMTSDSNILLSDIPAESELFAIVLMR